MKRRLFFIGVFFFMIVASLIFASITDSMAKNGKKQGVKLSTVDIGEDYEITGLVHYRSSELDPVIISRELMKQAEKMGADYVVGIIYYSHAGYLYGTGTAVKLIKNDE